MNAFSGEQTLTTSYKRPILDISFVSALSVLLILLLIIITKFIMLTLSLAMFDSRPRQCSTKLTKYMSRKNVENIRLLAQIFKR